MTERARIVFKSLLDPEAARLAAIESAQQGRLDPEFLLKRFGISSLLELDPSVSTAYLEKGIEENSVRKKVLADLGIKPLPRREIPPAVPNDRMVAWIPMIEKALFLESQQQPSKKDMTDWQRAESFFSRFTFPEATANLIELLGSKISFPANLIDSSIQPISEKVVRVRKTGYGEEIAIPGGQSDISCNPVYEEVAYDIEVTEKSFPAYRPTARGAETALSTIAFQTDHLRGGINRALEEYRANLLFHLIHTESGEIPGTREITGHVKLKIRR